MTFLKKSKSAITIFILSLLTSIFWCIAQLFNVYKIAVIGAIFEILWLPMIALLLALPILSLILLVKQKFDPKSLYLYSLLILLATVLFMIFKNSN